eukprot:38120-Eustigmatos_ZCMA.PRE.1
MVRTGMVRTAVDSAAAVRIVRGSSNNVREAGDVRVCSHASVEWHFVLLLLVVASFGAYRLILTALPRHAVSTVSHLHNAPQTKQRGK